MGEALLPLGRDANQGHHLVHTLVLLLPGHFREMQVQDLENLVAHRLGGVQAGHGVLEDHGDALAPQRQHFRLRQVQQLLTVIDDGTAGHLAHPFRQQPQDGQRQGGFSRAGLAHQAAGFAANQLQVEIVDRVNHCVVCIVPDGQIGNLHQVVLFLFHLYVLLISWFWGQRHPAGRRR